MRTLAPPRRVIWLANLLLALALAACAARPAPTPSGGITVVVPRGAAQALKSAVARYQQTGGPALTVIVLEEDFYGEQVSATLLAGLARYDLVYLDAGALARWVGYHALQPLAIAPDSGVNPWLGAVTVGGQPYGLPVQPDALVLWYRADLLAQHGLPVPRDWMAMRQAAAALNRPPALYGAAIAGSDQSAGVDFAAVLAGYGARAVSDAYQVGFDSPQARDALALYAGLSAADRVTPPDAAKLDGAGVVAALAEGRAALGLAPLSAAAQLSNCQASPKVCAEGKPLLAWAWLPGVAPTEAVGRVDALAVPVHAAHGLAAQRFLAWLSGSEGARAWAQGGGIPASTSVLAEPWSLQHIPGAAALSGLRDFRLAFPQAVTVDLLWQASNQAVHDAVAGQAAPDAALQAAADKMRQALRQGGY